MQTDDVTRARAAVRARRRSWGTAERPFLRK